MKHFARVIMDKQENTTISESFSEYNIYETEQEGTVFELPLPKNLSEEESAQFAKKLANVFFAEGYEDFDIEISADDLEEADEITIETVEDFHEEFGILGYAEDELWEAEYQGRTVKLNKPVRSSNGPKKFHVYVRDPKTKNVKKVNFGDPDSKIKKDNPERRRSFRARHNCDNPGPKTKARYWSCKKW